MPDDMSGFQNRIPASVRRQSEQADELHRTYVQAAPPVEGTPPAEPTNTEPVSVAPADPSPPASTSEGTAAAPSPAPPPVAPNTAAPGEDWEQRYRTLRGKYDAEVPELRTQLRALERSLGDTQAQLAARAAEPAPAPAPAAKPAAATTADVEAYGQELIDAVARWAKHAVMPEIEQLRREVVQAAGTAQQATARVAATTMEQRLDAEVPNWRTVNVAPEFFDWLAIVDDFTGRKRHELLHAAVQAGEADRVIRFFKAYEREHTAAPQAPPAAPQTPPAPPGAPSAGAPRLEDLAAPGRGSPGNPGAPATPQSFTQRQIAQFYTDVAKGRYFHNDAERIRIEAAIHKAVTEGRVTQ